MKTYKLEIVGFDDPARRGELYQLAEDCQQIVNRIWQLWECHHVIAGSREKILKQLAADKSWREIKRGERPKWTIDCFPLVGGKNRRGNRRTLRNQIETEIAETFSQVHGRVRTLLVNITCKKISQRKSATGNIRGWIAILLNRESRPSSTHALPIPFDCAHSKVIPAALGENAILQIRLARDERGRSAVEEFKLKTSGRASRYTKPIVRMATGEWAYKGSSLFYDARKKKWFALLVAEAAETSKSELIAGRTAILRCGFSHPIQVRIDGARVFLRDFGQGRAVAAVRRQLLTGRWGRQEGYRVAGSANKGHGRNRALGPVFLLSRRWKDFVRRYNHTLTSRMVARCIAEKASRLIYFQPSSGRFLDTAGKVSERSDSTGWDYFQIKTMLEYKCQEAGIEFVCHAPERKSKGQKILEGSG